MTKTPKSTALLDSKELARLYKEGVSAYKLAKDNHVNIWSILSRLRKEGAEIRPDGVPKTLVLTDTVKFTSLVNGLLLSDASINDCRTKKKCFLRLEQALERSGWLQQVQVLFTELGVYSRIIQLAAPKKPKYIEGRQIKTGPSELLYTSVCEEFRSFAQKWYPEGVKVVPDDLRIDSLCLAMWLCGDGSHDNNGHLTFYTNSFTRPHVEFLAHRMHSDLNINCVVNKHRKNEYLLVVSRLNDALKVGELVRPYIPSCCEYKISALRPSKFRDRLSAEEIQDIRAKKQQGLSTASIAEEYRLSRTSINNYVSGRRG